MRKHLALIVEHENEEYIGHVAFYEKRKSRLEKDARSPIQVYRDGDFETVGTEVGLGYHDFDSEQDLDENAWKVIRGKLEEISHEHLMDVGLSDELMPDGGNDTK